MKALQNIKAALQEVYKKKGYLVITVVFGVIVFLFNTLITNYQILISNFTFKLFFSLIAGTLGTMAIIPIILLIIISILSGVVVSMTSFLVRKQIKGTMGASSAGVLVSLTAPACPSCAIGLLSMRGLGGFIAVLPFKGLELGVAGIILLIVSLIFLSGKITTHVCKVK